MSKLKITAISELKTEKMDADGNVQPRVDGKKNRQYVTITFKDLANPMGPAVSRNFFQEHNSDGTECVWKNFNPKTDLSVGMAVPGYIKAFNVEEYQIDGRDVYSYTTAVLGHETKEKALRLCGHKLSADATPAFAEEADGDLGTT
jgi:hypothetical protein